nr:twin-arginine translocation signal domain-containing protein [Natrialba chahannaoensis]
MRRPPFPSRRSRRAFLGGTAVAGTAALAGCTTLYHVLPDRIVYARTRRRDIPEVPPAVETTDAHVRETADRIAEHADAALAVWDRLDEPFGQTPVTRGNIESADEFATEAPTKPPVVSTVESTGLHLHQAAQGDAYARAVLDGFDDDPTEGVDDGLEAVTELASQFEYETAAPETFLAYGKSIEHSLHQAESGLSRRRDAEIADSDRSDRAEQIATVYSGVQRSRLRVRDAKAYREALRERDSGSESIRDSLAESRDELEGRIDDLRATREEWGDRFDADEFEGERRDVRSALYSRSASGESDLQRATRYLDDGYEVYGTVALADVWLRLTAARDEWERFETDGTDELDAVVIDEAKRDAVSRLEDLLVTDPEPLTRLFCSEARTLVSVGDLDLAIDAGEMDEDQRWSLANGYARYMLARGMLDRIPEAVDLLTGDRS